MAGTLNLGILAHVDAGKTSLTERLLYDAGVIDAIGSVDAGSTTTDSMALERQRGITIRSAVASFVVDGTTINLIDTPGHPDFIAEVERVLRVLDGVVLVVSAVDGVQPQTRVLWRALHRLHLPTIFFVNKIDRAGADPRRVADEIATRLTGSAIPLGDVAHPGTTRAAYQSRGRQDPDFRARLVDELSLHDDGLLAAYVRAEGQLSDDRVRTALVEQSRTARVHPVLAGSAVTGAGVPALTSALTELLPTAGGRPDTPVSGTVFAVRRGASGERRAYVRLTAGTLRVRDHVQLPDGRCPRVTAIEQIEGGTPSARSVVRAGEIVLLGGLGRVQIDDQVGAGGTDRPQWHFSAPALETVIVPVRPADRIAVHGALLELAEQDPLIDLRQDDLRQELSVSLYGEVQKEVIGQTLRDDYGLDVTFRATTTLCLERVAASGSAVEVINLAPNPFLATVGLRIDAAPMGSGVTYGLGVEPGAMPPTFFTAIEETVHRTLAEGLHGWPVTDCRVTLERTGYWARQSSAHGSFDASMSSTAGDFRRLTPLVLMAALAAAGTEVCAPVLRFTLDLPEELLGSVLPQMTALGAVPLAIRSDATSAILTGTLPAARLHDLQVRMPTMTRGDGVLDYTLDHHAPVRGPVPARPRTTADPRDRQAHLLADGRATR